MIFFYLTFTENEGPRILSRLHCHSFSFASYKTPIVEQRAMG